MNRILVVDDSAVDRYTVGMILEKNEDMQIVYCNSGDDALAKLRGSGGDLVVTDLMMPDMDGLELVCRMRKEFRSVPVVLVTAKGSAELAVEALQSGAASYVQKRYLEQDLVPAIRQVLSASKAARDRERGLSCVDKMTYSATLRNDPSLISPLLAVLHEGMERITELGEGDIIRGIVALEEVLCWAVYQGNLEVSSEIKHIDADGYRQLVDLRLSQPPFRERRVYVNAYFSRKEARFVIRDEGPGFDVSSLPDPTDPSNLEIPSGRGMLLVRTFMDEVYYNEVGNEVTLVKRAAS